VRAVFPLLLCLAACGPGVPRSPREAVVAFRDAFFAGDPGALHACAFGTPEEYRALDAWLESDRALREFRAAFVAEYGAGAWEEFQDEAGAHFPADAWDDAQVGRLEFAIEGDRAVCTGPGADGGFRLRRALGGWRVEIASLLPPGLDPRRAALGFDTMAEFLRVQRGRIGQPGVTPTSLDVDVGLGQVRIREAVRSAVLTDAPGR